MMQETYLIKLRDNSIYEDFAMVASFLKRNKAQIIMASSQRFWIVAILNQRLAEVVKRLPSIEIVGGVTFRKREVRVIRIQKQ